MTRPSPQTDRVVTLLNVLAANPSAGLTVSEIARRLGVNKATCYPMLAALQQAGWLVRHPGRKTFHLGPALVPIGRAAAVGLPTSELVHATLVDLSHELGVTCAAIAPAADHVVVIDQATPHPHRAPTLRPGQRLPMRAPWGAVFVAWGDDDVVERWLAHAGDDRDRWRDVLAAVRSIGVVVELDESLTDRVRDEARRLSPALGRDELQAVVERLVDELSRQRQPLLTDLDRDGRHPVVSINAPVRDADGTVMLGIAAMGFTAPLDAAEVRRIASRVRAAAPALTPSQAATTANW